MSKTNYPLDKVRELQRALYRAAKRSATRRFHALYDKICRTDILQIAWKRVKANRGVAGVDEQTIQDIEETGVEVFINQIRQELFEGHYRPQAVRRRWIEKPGRTEKRPLGIPAVRDRVVQMAIKLVIEPIFEADFYPCSFGFRPKRSAHDANEVIRQKANKGYDWVVDTDIKSYFDTIDHDRLMAMVAERISDRRMVKLIQKFLKAGVLEDGKVRALTTGTPQGGVISPLMANIYLNYLDKIWMEQCCDIGVLVRYADDLVVLCRSEVKAQEALRRLNRVMVLLGLQLHPDKTRLVNLKGGEKGFDFLGFHHRKVCSWRYNKYYLLRLPGRKAMKSVREKVRSVVGSRRGLHRPLKEVISELNPIVRGWGNYFAVGNSSQQFQKIDSYVQERLFLFLSKKHAKRGRGWSVRWKHINFRAEGLYFLSGTVKRHNYSVHAVG